VGVTTTGGVMTGFGVVVDVGGTTTTAVLVAVVVVAFVSAGAGAVRSRDVKSLAPFTASAIQLKLTSAGAGLLRTMVKPATFLRVTMNLTSPSNKAFSMSALSVVEAASK